MIIRSSGGKNRSKNQFDAGTAVINNIITPDKKLETHPGGVDRNDLP